MPGNENTGIKSGTILGGRYRVENLIGQGGMGAVYRSTHVELGREVAVKTLHPQFMSDESVTQRFRLEAQMAASIGHDNICEVIDVGTADDGTGYLVMPLLTGAALSDLLQSKQLSLHLLLDIICQTLSALQAAHDAHIVHRDLKPDNIFITKIGDRDNFVKLLDFGISKIMDQESVSKLTRTGMVVGTPCYMSPEQAKGARDLDYRVDIYAIGVILYEALTGTCPFDGETYNEVIFKIVAEPFPTPASLNSDIPKELEHIVLKAMARNVEDRYESASQMRDKLKVILAGEKTGSYAAMTSDTAAMAGASPFTPTALRVGEKTGSVHSAPTAADARPPSEMAPAATSPAPSEMPLTPSEWSVDQQSLAPAANRSRALVALLVVVAVALAGILVFLLLRGNGAPIPVAAPIAEPPQPLSPPQLIEGESSDEASQGGRAAESAEPVTASSEETKAETKDPEPKKRAQRKSRRKSPSQTVAREEQKNKSPVPVETKEPDKKIVIIETLPDDPKPEPKKPAPKPRPRRSKKMIDGKYGSKYVSDY